MQIDWMMKLRLRLRDQVRRLSVDTRGIAAVEFAMLVPLMLMVFFGTIQISTAVAVDRKVSLTARTLSDLISQAATINDTDISNAFGLSTAIMNPYLNTSAQAQLLQSKITQIYVDSTKAPKLVWSKASNATARSCSDPLPVPVPTELLIADTYLILSEVTYNYQPIVGYDIKASFVSSTYPLGDSMYTRPRQAKCVLYPAVTVCPGVPTTATNC
jgi:Flp pilus assembly protein TadG